MAKTHGLGLHHPIDHRAARLAGAKAMPEVFTGIYHQARGGVVVKGAQTNELLAMRLELDAFGLHQPLQAHLSFESLDFVAWYAGHGSSQKDLVKQKMNVSCVDLRHTITARVFIRNVYIDHGAKIGQKGLRPKTRGMMPRNAEKSETSF
jgi:hypothetical protein